MKTLLTVIGTRPQFIKYAALAGSLDAHYRHVVVDTGQHYDHALAGAFVDEYGLRPADHTLETASTRPAQRLGQMLDALSAVIDLRAPDALLCFGDTDSTLAAALAAVKCHVPVFHIEAGERSMTASGTRTPIGASPEETNRVLVDHVASMLLCATREAAENLQTEGITGRIQVTGDILFDLFLRQRGKLDGAEAWRAARGLRSGDYYYATVHRAVNTDTPSRLASILRAFSLCGLPVWLPLHPRAEKMLREHELLELYADHPSLKFIPPVNHSESLMLAAGARAVLTDSGGVMREAYFLQVPSICLDDSTAWINICRAGWSEVTGADESAIISALERPIPTTHPPLFGDGTAVERTLAAIRDALG